MRLPHLINEQAGRSCEYPRCASAMQFHLVRRDDRRSPESVCGPLIRTTDAPDRDFCHRYADRRLWLARNHNRVQPTFAGVTAREPRVCQADKALSRLREIMNCAVVSVARILEAMDQTLVLS